jgi:hypothetical protein
VIQTKVTNRRGDYMTISTDWSETLFSDCMRGSFKERSHMQDLRKKKIDHELGYEIVELYSWVTCDGEAIEG